MSTALAHTPSHYAVLGLQPDASPTEIRNAYRRLALKWHPDRWQRQPRLVDEANHRFLLVQEAYQVLSDGRKRSAYDAGFYDSFQFDETDEEVNGFAAFVGEMLELMSEVKREGREYGLNELQGMLDEMRRGCEPEPESRRSKRCRKCGQ